MTDLDADDVTLPVKRTDGATVEDRLTENAYQNILPARYLRKDQDGELIEAPEDLFERVAKNIALAEAVFEAEARDVAVTVTPDQVKPDHPRRDELAAEVFGTGTAADDDARNGIETLLEGLTEAEREPPERVGPVDLVRELRDPDVQHGLGYLLAMAGAIGRERAGDDSG